MKKVLILIDTARVVGRKFLAGVERYINSHDQWEVCTLLPDYLIKNGQEQFTWFKLDEADGIIALDSKFTIEILKLNVPKLVSDTILEVVPGSTSIYTDSDKIGKKAAEYFIGLGFTNFAFCGFDDIPWSNKRFSSFSDIIKSSAAGRIFNYSDYPNRNPIGSFSDRVSIADWLESLPKPVSVFACNDDRGINVLEACRIAKLKVPEEVAVLGVDNDELVCGLSSPPMSSIDMNFEGAGYDSAKILNDQMDSGSDVSDITVEPFDIITRQSSNIMAVDDIELTNALVFIRQNYQKNIQVQDVVNSTSVSRRELELRFQKLLKKSIKDEINKHRIQLAKRKLMYSSQPIYVVANSLSFTDPEHFARFFKKNTGMSPRQFRRNYS